MSKISWNFNGIFENRADRISDHTLRLSGYGMSGECFCALCTLLELLSDEKHCAVVEEAFVDFVGQV